MSEPLYTFKGQDVTWPMCIQMRDVTHIIMERLGIGFVEATRLFYPSRTCRIMQQPDNGLWAESAPYIADQFFKEYENKD